MFLSETRKFQSDGTGSFSIYGGSQFADENFQVKHSSPGMLSMVSAISPASFPQSFTLFFARFLWTKATDSQTVYAVRGGLVTDT